MNILHRGQTNQNSFDWYKIMNGIWLSV